MGDAGILCLPDDVLRHVLRFLNVRSLLNLACTCRTFAALARDVPLHPVMTSRLHMLDWLTSPSVAARVASLTARCSMWGRCSWVSHLRELRRLVVAFGHVSAPIFRHLPTSIEHLDLHRLDCEYGDVFDMRRLTRLTRLRTLKLTFTPHWDVVVVGDLEALPHLRQLSIRQAPALLVRAPLRVADVHLHSVSVFVCAHPVAAERLSLECTDGVIPLDLVVTPATAPLVRELSLSCPYRVTVPALDCMRSLERLRLRYDCVLLPLRHLASLTALTSVSLDTRYGVAVTGVGSQSLPADLRIDALVGGVPMAPEVRRALFRQPA